MALNTTVQPFIQQMFQQPDPKSGGEALTGAINNFMGAYVAGKEGQRAEQARKSTNPQSYDEAVDGASNPPDKPGRFENFAKAYLGAQGQVAMGANPALRPQVEILNQRVREGLLEERTLNQITSQDPMRVAEEAGNLTPSQVPQWLQKNAALRAVPWGQKIWDGVAAAYGDSEQAKISSAKAKATADRQIQMTQQGLNSDSESDNVVFNRNNAFKAAAVAAKTAEKSFDPSLLQPGWVDANGRVNDEALYSSIAKMPISETLRVRDENADALLRSRNAHTQFLEDMARGRFQQAQDRINNPPPTALQKNVGAITGLKNRIASLPSGAERSSLESELAIYEKMTNKPGVTVYDPATGKPIVTMGGAGVDATTAMRNQATEKMESLSELDSVTRELQRSVSTETFGPLSALYRVVVNKGIANFSPGVFNEEAARVETQLPALKAALVKAYRSDGNIAESERKILDSMSPSLGIIESPADAATKFQTIRRMSAQIARAKARSIGKPIPAFALTKNELAKRYQIGKEMNPNMSADEQQQYDDMFLEFLNSSNDYDPDGSFLGLR